MAYRPPLYAGITGNTAGNNVVLSTGTVHLAGGNNITLSQTTGANGGTISINGPAGGGGPAISAAGQSVSNGTITFSNSNGMGFGMAGSVITASHNGLTSQSGQALSASNGSFSFQTAGFSNANGITFGTSAGSIMTASVNTSYAASNHSHGNPTLALTNISGTTASASNGLTLSLSAAAGGGGGFDAGALSNDVGGTTTGTMGTNTNGLFLYAGTNIGLSQETDTNGASVTVYAADGVARSGAFYDNMIQQSNSIAVEYTSLSNAIQNRLLVQPFDPSNDLFPFDMTISTMFLDFSNSGTSSHSAAHSSSFYFGLYTRVNSTQLSLVNSVSTTVGMAANVANSNSYIGARYLSFHSSIFSSSPVMSGDKRYYFGFLARSAGTYYQSNSIAGMHYGMSNQRSGFIGTTAQSNTSLNAWHPFMGVHSITTHTNMPGSIANADINKVSAYANFIPRVILNAGGGLLA